MSLDISTVVVADDHELFRSALAQVLRREFKVRTIIEAKSLAEAVEALERASDVALVSIDLAMPGMDGAASLQRIRAAFPSVRLVVVTGSERREDVLLTLGAGAHGFIPKTYGICEIAAALRVVLKDKIFVPPAIAEIGVDAILPQAAPPVAALEQKAGRINLSPRQSDVLNLMMQGKSNKEIARGLGLAEGTVKVHVAALFRALGAHNRVSAIAALTLATGDRATAS